MGYDVHITRKPGAFALKGPEISRKEWLAFIAKDASMRLDTEALVKNSKGEVFSIHDETLAAWMGWPDRQAGQREAWMWHSAGNVVAKDPDQAVRQKMFEIAKALNAHLQGEDQEIYDESGLPVDANFSRRRWWHFW